MRDLCLENERLREEKLNSPASTPISSTDEENCLVHITSYSTHHTQLNTKEIRKYCVQNIPYFLLVMSIVETTFFLASDTHLRTMLRFEPQKKYQLWRCFTYMLVHEDFVHLILNVVLQCVFAFFIEKKQGRLRVGIVYLAGGVTGVLGASCLSPGILIGASAGVYSLLMSLISDLYVNYENTKYKIYRILCIIVIVLSDISFNLYHYLSRDEPLISWEAHVFGGFTGFVLGLAIYKISSKSGNEIHQERKDIWVRIGLPFYFLMMISLVIITIVMEALASTAEMKV